VLPPGDWCDYWSGEKVGGGATIQVKAVLDKIPVYVKSGSVFPVAAICNSSKEAELNNLTARIYGDGSLPWSTRGAAKDRWELRWNADAKRGTEQGSSSYRIVRWQEMS
jgi:alpha-D-xyloside xylohydrolase